MPYQNPKLFIDPDITYPVGTPDLPFAEYIAQCKRLISEYRLDLQTDGEKIIAANSPFELRPATGKKIRYGALLIHGLLDSPFQMRDMGHYLQSRGFLARSILMPGHGTVPGALLHVDYHQWLQTLEYAYATLAQEVEKVFLVGHSTGAALGIYHALRDPQKVAGLVLLAPALKINSPLSPLADWPLKVGNFWPRANWFHIEAKGANDYAKYSSLTFNAIYQVYRLTCDIKRFAPIKQLACPLFFALSENDDIICPRRVIQFFEGHHHPRSRLILYSSRPKTPCTDYRIIMRSSVYPQWHIRHFSHVCVPISPDNPHYGKEGDYPFASHVETTDATVFGEYSRLQISLGNLLYRCKLSKHRYQRLTFNPDFEFLTQQLDLFLKDYFD